MKEIPTKPRGKKLYKGNSIQAIANFVYPLFLHVRFAWIRLPLAKAASSGIKTAQEDVNKNCKPIWSDSSELYLSVSDYRTYCCSLHSASQSCCLCFNCSFCVSIPFIFRFSSFLQFSFFFFQKKIPLPQKKGRKIVSFFSLSYILILLEKKIKHFFPSFLLWLRWKWKRRDPCSRQWFDLRGLFFSRKRGESVFFLPRYLLFKFDFLVAISCYQCC